MGTLRQTKVCGGGGELNRSASNVCVTATYVIYAEEQEDAEPATKSAVWKQMLNTNYCLTATKLGVTIWKVWKAGI